MKDYIGIRSQDACRVYVEEDGVRWPLEHLVCHSPTGLEWGYGGCGPADLAISLIADADPALACPGRVPPVEPSLYESFKRDVVCSLPHDGWRISAVDVRRWIECDTMLDADDARRLTIVQIHPLVAEGGMEGKV